MALGKTHQIQEPLALTQDPEHLHQQEVPGGDTDTATHPDIVDRLEVAEQIEIGCGRNSVGH
jgi:hypothetical protein